MWAHAQYCMSGDTTLEAAEAGVESCLGMRSPVSTLSLARHIALLKSSSTMEIDNNFPTAEEADDYFVMLLSDANLKRYAIPPEDLGEVLTRDPKVKAFALFIAGGREAERLAAALRESRPAFIGSSLGGLSAQCKVESPLPCGVKRTKPPTAALSPLMIFLTVSCFAAFGRGLVCMDTKNLPTVFKEIFAAASLENS